MKRKIAGLKWARRLAARPGFIPIGRARGVKAFGTRYEKAFAKAIGARALRGVWFEFEDRNGLGVCQVDFLIETSTPIVLELKHSWVEDGQIELDSLYLPVVAKALGETPLGVVVVSNLTPRMGRAKVCGSMGEAVDAAESRPAVLQWRPKTPLIWDAWPVIGPSLDAFAPRPSYKSLDAGNKA